MYFAINSLVMNICFDHSQDSRCSSDELMIILKVLIIFVKCFALFVKTFTTDSTEM